MKADAMRYTIAVVVTVPVDEDGPVVGVREAERLVIKLLAKSDLCDCDAEVIDWEYVDIDGMVIPVDLVTP